MTLVLFACVHNAGRSQMAAAFFNQLTDPEKARAVSAGTSPGPHVHPEVLLAMKESGIDLSGAQPQLLTTELASGATHLVTMGCGEQCPVVRGVRACSSPAAPLGRAVSDITSTVRLRTHRLLIMTSTLRTRASSHATSTGASG